MPSVAPGWLREQAAQAVPRSRACASGSPFQAAQTILGVDDAIRVLQTAREEFGLCTREL